MVGSEGLSVFTRHKVGGPGGMLPREKLNFQYFRNTILGILAELLHYYRCCHYNTYIQENIDKSMTKKLMLPLFYQREVICGG